MPSRRFKKVYVEISNICNLQCDFCPEVERDKKIMGEALFEKIIRDVAPLTEEVCFHLMGEPLTHPRFAQYVEFCGTQSVPVNITTNGVLLNESREAALLHPAVRQVNFSLHSFKSNFPDKDITPYLEKIIAFTRRALKERPDLYINYRLWNLTDAQTGPDNNSELLEKIEAAFGISLNRTVDVTRRKNKNILGRLYLHFDTRFDWPSLQSPIRGTKGFCYGLSSQMAIHADGTVVPCCLDKEAGVNLGNCGEVPVIDIVEGDRAKKVAEGFQKRKLIEDLCQRCTFIERFA